MTPFCAPCINRSRLIDRLCRLIRGDDCIILQYISLIIFMRTLINYTTILKKIIAASRFSRRTTGQRIINRVLREIDTACTWRSIKSLYTTRSGKNGVIFINACHYIPRCNLALA